MDNGASHGGEAAGTRPRSVAELVASLPGSAAALGRLLTFVEQGGERAHEVGRALLGRGGNAYTLGITGAPGAGKSTLTTRVVGALRAGGHRVAVLAIDPSSPFSGGALLGDRVRMVDHSLDDGVFIRSMATRGSLGGLAAAAPEAVRVLDAAGFDHVLLETVGVGQIELEVAAVADTTLVVVNPGWGDHVQAAKAGLLEIADVFAVNKADRGGGRETRRMLRDMLRLRRTETGGWEPPIVETSATEGSGIDELLAEVDAHRQWLAAQGELERRRGERLWSEVERLFLLHVADRSRALAPFHGSEELRKQVLAGETEPWAAAELLAERILPAAAPAD
ncbi:MAG TPA: methylmalonyl Co-A mutase-associated GTPase MeaB [Gaiellaceae bacterium]|nr:methylmalonyl Co-A mutase-associated GTPase MeaB [Gaiellaceae bacterium]